jgi:hypothetical protein
MVANLKNSFNYWFLLLALFMFGGIESSQAATVSLSNYGAVADGSTDNLAAINRAISAAGPGGTVNIPAGKFAYRGVISITGVKLVGAGPSSSILYALDYNNEAIFMYGSGSEVRNLQLTGVISSTRMAAWPTTHITLLGASNFVIDNNYIEGSAAAGIQTAQSANNGRITNNRIRNTNADSIHMTDKASFITVEGNYIENSGDDGIAVVSYQYDGTTVHDITTRNNKIINNRAGRNVSVVGGSNILIENNYIDGNPRYACVYLAQEASYTTFGVSNTTVQYNTLKNCGSSSTGHFDIMLFSDGSYPDQNVKLIRNDIYAPFGGIKVYGDVRSSVLDSNRITGGTDYSISSSGVSLIRYVSGSVGYVDPGTSPSPSPTPTSTQSYNLSITSPAANATVSGTITIKGVASGFLNVEVSDNAGNLLAQVSPDAAGNFSASVDTTKLANGTQTLRIDAWDAAAGQPYSQTAEKLLSLNIQNGVAPSPSPSPSPTPASSYIITISSPASGATVSGIIQVKGSAPGMLNVEIFDAASNLLAQVTPDSAGNFSASVDTTKLANGSQNLRIDAWDAAAGQAYSHSDEKLLSINVQNVVAAPVDTQAPSVSITSPGNGASFATRSTISVNASASDNVGVVDVKFYLNGTLMCTDSTAAYSCSMRLPKQRRTLTIEAVGRDAAGNVGRQSIVVYTK